MADGRAPPSVRRGEGRRKMAAETGKRYRCTTCGAEFIVTRGSAEGELRCGGEPLEQI